MSEENKEAVNKETEKTAEEIKAEAEALEAKIKEEKDKKSDEYKFGQQRRLEKAKERLAKLSDPDYDEDETEKPSVDIGTTKDLITLAKFDLDETSEKAKILARYKAGGIIKSYAEGLNHTAIKAEFAELDSKNTAKTVIDENDSDEVRMKTTKEIVRQYRQSGEVPSDKKLQAEIAKANLKDMGI